MIWDFSEDAYEQVYGDHFMLTALVCTFVLVLVRFFKSRRTVNVSVRLEKTNDNYVLILENTSKVDIQDILVSSKQGSPVSLIIGGDEKIKCLHPGQSVKYTVAFSYSDKNKSEITVSFNSRWKKNITSVHYV